ncbi:MAG: DNA gyrase inhibitor YacG [Succinivibrio sp.]
MSLRDLLSPEIFDEIAAEAKDSGQKISAEDGVIKVKCPICKKETIFDKTNPFRPFCSERCRLIDLGAWANRERYIKGRSVNEDVDGELLNSPNLEKYNFPKEE